MTETDLRKSDPAEKAEDGGDDGSRFKEAPSLDKVLDNIPGGSPAHDAHEDAGAEAVTEDISDAFR